MLPTIIFSIIKNELYSKEIIIVTVKTAIQKVVFMFVFLFTCNILHVYYVAWLPEWEWPIYSLVRWNKIYHQLWFSSTTLPRFCWKFL